jgi:hypothetical protein
MIVSPVYHNHLIAFYNGGDTIPIPAVLVIQPRRGLIPHVSRSFSAHHGGVIPPFQPFLPLFFNLRRGHNPHSSRFFLFSSYITAGTQPPCQPFHPSHFTAGTQSPCQPFPSPYFTAGTQSPCQLFPSIFHGGDTIPMSAVFLFIFHGGDTIPILSRSSLLISRRGINSHFGRPLLHICISQGGGTIPVSAVKYLYLTVTQPLRPHTTAATQFFPSQPSRIFHRGVVLSVNPPNSPGSGHLTFWTQ